MFGNSCFKLSYIVKIPKFVNFYFYFQKFDDDDVVIAEKHNRTVYSTHCVDVFCGVQKVQMFFRYGDTDFFNFRISR